MSKSVVINLGVGTCHHGFPTITAQIWSEHYVFPEQFVGSLPANPTLLERYQEWQFLYQHLYDDQQFLAPADDAQDIEIEETDITNVSVVGLNDLSEELQAAMNRWLGSSEFLHIDQQLRSKLTSAEEIRVIIETSDLQLRRLPWHCWNLFRDFPKAEMALSRPEYQRAFKNRSNQPQKVRILGILGNSLGLDFEAERTLLDQITDAETVFLVNPTRQELNEQLWNPSGWNLLFFAGHSQTNWETGQIYINDHQIDNSLTIEQLNQGLTTAIENGLELAIFNSCDGLGLAIALEKLNIPTTIVMREPVSNRVAQEFFQYFLEAFAVRRLSLYLSVQQARRKLQAVESEFPGASWLPVICQNPASEPPTWLTLGGMPPCPYRGLFAFGAEDADFYFGREQATQDLVTAVKTKPLVTVVGASGSGKSSIIFAGLIPAIWASPEFNDVQNAIAPQIVAFRPGHDPVSALASALAPLIQNNVLETTLRQNPHALTQIVETVVKHSGCSRMILIVDQFEELYTLNPKSQHQAFLEGLLNACSNASSFTLVLTLRADFYGYAVSDRQFSDALQGAVYNLSAMNREELWSAISKPAALMQVQLSENLIEQLINATIGHPGRLPLLEFALTQMWSKQRGGHLTQAAYEEIGGVEQALANHAERVYAQLSLPQRLAMQRILIQLVQPGTMTDFNRRLATCDEVGYENWELVIQLADARLLVTNRNQVTQTETVEIVHEALIHSWGRFENWLLLAAEFRLWQEQLRSRIDQWERSGFDAGALLRGKPLADAQDWQQKRPDELSLRERDFIEQSSILVASEQRSQKRRQRLILSGLVGGLIVTSTFAIVAWREWRNSMISEIKAIDESSQALFASNQKLDALKEAIRAKRKQETLGRIDLENQSQIESVLRQAVYGATEFNRLEGHTGEVKAGTFSPDGTLFVSGSTDKTVKLWKRDGTLIATLTGHQAGILDVAFSSDSQMFASASEDKTIKLWKRDGTLIATLNGHDAAVTKVAFSPTKNILASASDDRTLKLWNTSGTLLKTLKRHQESVKSLAFSPDGNTIASAGADNTIRLWNKEGDFLKTIVQQNIIIWDVAFSPDGKTIAAANGDNTVKLWNRDGKLIKTLEGHQSPVASVAFSLDGKTIVSGSWENTVKVWNKKGDLLTTLSGHRDRIWRVMFSPDSQLIASISGDKAIKFWKLDSPSITTLRGHTAPVIGVAVSPNGKIIASASDDATVKLWTQDQTLPLTLDHKAAAYGVAFSPDSQTLASSGADSTVKLWNTDGVLLKTLRSEAGIWGVAFSPDGTMIASGGWDKALTLWNKDGTVFKILKGYQEAIWDVAFSPAGDTIATASGDMTLRLWKRDGTLMSTIRGHKAGIWGVTFSPDGELIATASEDKTVKLWKRDGTLLSTLEGHQSIVFGVAFSPDSQLLATSSADKTIKLWDMRTSTPNLKVTLNGHQGRVWGAVFSPDGKTLISSSEDKTVKLWNLDQVVDFGQVFAQGCDWARDYLKTNPNVNESDRHLCD